LHESWSKQGIGKDIAHPSSFLIAAQQPLVTIMRTVTAQFIGILLAEFQAPLPHRFIGHDDPALCQKFLNRTEN
jgi:hypothetical protein